MLVGQRDERGGMSAAYLADLSDDESVVLLVDW